MADIPKISIITPTLNSEAVLKECILSVARQTHPNKEHIIVDGKSTDRTLEIIKKYAEKYPHIRWISEEDKGIYEAMNKGIDLSEGEWLYFLGSDDIFYDKNVLEGLFAEKDFRNLDIIYGNVKFKASGKIYDGQFTLSKLIESNICHQAIFHKKNIYKIIGKYETKYKGMADWVLNMQWFNDKKVRKKYFNKKIAVFDEKRCWLDNVDEEFFSHKREIVKKNFSPFMFFLYITKLTLFIEITRKGINVLKKHGMKVFLANLYKYFKYGRRYFRGNKIETDLKSRREQSIDKAKK